MAVQQDTEDDAPYKGGVSAKSTDAKGMAAVAAALRADILRGDYRFRLPSERALAQRFNASRGTIRAALRQLQRANLVATRKGSGTFVADQTEQDDDIHAILNITSPLELIECRLAIEPDLARLAVLNAGTAALEHMRDAVEEAEAAPDDPDRFSSADERFHLTLAECSGNRLLLWIYRRINDIRQQTQWSARKHSVLTPPHIAEYNRQHREIFAAISVRDARQAVRTINAHLEKARAQLLGDSE